MTDQPSNMNPVDIRLEILVGHIADQLPILDEIEALRLQSNASVTTRGKLDPLVELTGSIRETLEHIREKAAAMRKALEAEPASTDVNSD
jgi:hypothetical protein